MTLTLQLEHTGPVPLSEFTYALQRLASRYTRETRASDSEEGPHLYISEIRKGSIIVALVVGASTAALAGVGIANNLATFAGNIQKLLDHFRGQATDLKPSKADCDDARALAQAVFNTAGGQMNFYLGPVHDDALARMNEVEARAIDNRAALERQALAQKEENLLQGVLLVWDQVRNAPGVDEGRSPDRGIIQEIDGKSRQVTFSSDDIKEQMGWHGFNPFDKAFVVDVKVLVGPNGPVAYRVLKIHDVLDRE